MANVVVKSNHLTFGGKQYFRGGAEDVLLGSFGEKKTPLTKQNYLEVQGTIPASKLKVRSATECTIDFTNSDTFAVSHSGVAEGVIDGVPVKASVSGNASVDFGSKGHLRLVKLIVENGDMGAFGPGTDSSIRGNPVTVNQGRGERHGASQLDRRYRKQQWDL